MTTYSIVLKFDATQFKYLTVVVEVRLVNVCNSVQTVFE